MKTIDENNIHGTGSVVADNDIQGISPCAFVKSNPISGEICTEPFVGNKLLKKDNNRSALKDKPIANIYTALVSF